eukprot:TRINITY_DN4556_c0_g1_i1.p2 TRINITY_DN4556_c0_g1~~TRINITY_DN4556_c0_g1_i1.p2  ORF type:complete len:530 (-),score=85.13 TRINITY_DN4556_c0_g1_i1:12-1601(-)
MSKSWTKYETNCLGRELKLMIPSYLEPVYEPKASVIIFHDIAQPTGEETPPIIVQKQVLSKPTTLEEWTAENVSDPRSMQKNIKLCSYNAKCLDIDDGSVGSFQAWTMIGTTVYLFCFTWLKNGTQRFSGSVASEIFKSLVIGDAVQEHLLFRTFQVPRKMNHGYFCISAPLTWKAKFFIDSTNPSITEPVPLATFEYKNPEISLTFKLFLDRSLNSLYGGDCVDFFAKNPLETLKQYQKLLVNQLEKLTEGVSDYKTKPVSFGTLSGERLLFSSKSDINSENGNLIDAFLITYAPYVYLDQLQNKGCGIISIQSQYKKKKDQRIAEDIFDRIASSFLPHSDELLLNTIEDKYKRKVDEEKKNPFLSHVVPETEITYEHCGWGFGFKYSPDKYEPSKDGGLVRFYPKIPVTPIDPQIDSRSGELSVFIKEVVSEESDISLEKFVSETVSKISTAGQVNHKFGITVGGKPAAKVVTSPLPGVHVLTHVIRLPKYFALIKWAVHANDDAKLRQVVGKMVDSFYFFDANQQQ